MTPLIVTAELATAYSTNDRYSPSLDGILAYWQLREQLGEEEFALGATGHRPLIEPDLPLAKEHWDDLWWYQASAPLVNVVETFDRHVHRRFDDQPGARFLPAKTKTIETKSGPYKIYRLQHEMRVAPSMAWHVVGDEQEIRRLLRQCHTIGFGHTKGYGEVVGWRFEPAPDDSVARFYRPLPVAFARAHDISGMPRRWGIRPPGRIPAHQTLCVMP